MAKRLSDRVKELEAENARLMEQLTEVQQAYQEASEQLEQFKEKQSESKRNERGAGRKPTEQTAVFIRFCKLYDSGSSRKEIESIMGITDSTYFRYLKLHREGHPTIDDVVEDDIIAVRCIDDDVVIKGKVCKDSSGRLYMVYADKFSDEIVYYPGGSDELLEIIRV